MNTGVSSFSFRDTLTKRQEQTWNVLCVWLDPKESKKPEEFKSVYDWMKSVVDISASWWATMFKPQSAHWEAIPLWKEILKKLISYIKETYPDIVIFEDCKRWDIWATQEMYRDAILKIDWAQWMNFNPYMWKDCYTSLIDPNNPWNSLVGLCRTSNPDAWLMQDIKIAWGVDMKYYEYVAYQMKKWTEEQWDTNAWLVMWAAHEFKKFGFLNKHAEENPDIRFRIPEWEPNDFYSGHFINIRRIVGEKLWFLIPWIWSQTWSEEDNIRALEATILNSFVWFWSIAINSSSGISEAHLNRKNEWLTFERAVEKEVGFLTGEMKRIIDWMELI